MGDYGTDFQPTENPLEHVGYCPQVNPLWPRITLQEHLEIYAAMKGLHQRDIPNIIKRYQVSFFCLYHEQLIKTNILDTCYA